MTDDRFLLIPLFDAERSWSYAMQLKQEGSDATGTDDKTAKGDRERKKFHLMNRLRKAVAHANHLEQLCRTAAQVDVATKLESQAYCAWMHGNRHFEGHNWALSMAAFSKAQTIYAQLANVVKVPQLCDAYKQRCADMQPQLRYCQYETGSKTATLDELMQMRLNINEVQGAQSILGDIDVGSCTEFSLNSCDFSA